MQLLCICPWAKAGPSDGGYAYGQEQGQELQMPELLPQLMDPFGSEVSAFADSRMVTLGDEMLMEELDENAIVDILEAMSEMRSLSGDEPSYDGKWPPTLLCHLTG